MKYNIEPINIFDFDGTLTTETWPKFWVWVKKFGYSDAVAMKFVHNNGGKAIFVHQANEDDELYNYNNKIYEKLNVDGMVDFKCIADYTDGSMLSNILKR